MSRRCRRERDEQNFFLFSSLVLVLRWNWNDQIMDRANLHQWIKYEELSLSLSFLFIDQSFEEFQWLPPFCQHLSISSDKKRQKENVVSSMHRFHCQIITQGYDDENAEKLMKGSLNDHLMVGVEEEEVVEASSSPSASPVDSLDCFVFDRVGKSDPNNSRYSTDPFLFHLCNTEQCCLDSNWETERWSHPVHNRRNYCHRKLPHTEWSCDALDEKRFEIIETSLDSFTLWQCLIVKTIRREIVIGIIAEHCFGVNIVWWIVEGTRWIGERSWIDIWIGIRIDTRDVVTRWGKLTSFSQSTTINMQNWREISLLIDEDEDPFITYELLKQWRSKSKWVSTGSLHSTTPFECDCQSTGSINFLYTDDQSFININLHGSFSPFLLAVSEKKNAACISLFFLSLPLIKLYLFVLNRSWGFLIWFASIHQRKAQEKRSTNIHPLCLCTCLNLTRDKSGMSWFVLSLT